MKSHIITRADEKKLFELEALSKYSDCIEILSKSIAASVSNSCLDEDMQYELGAAYVRLAIYYLLCGNDEHSSSIMTRAKSILPELDRIALAAIHLSENESNKDLVNDLCSEFFQLSENSLFELDGISNVYYESMLEIRKNLINTYGQDL